ncbi:apolipoprotein acyltransferase [Ruegeria sp. 2012CJ41-6]|uniref:Apolipoprotein acyltransferase n=1 Tax=Ruegeria spongiae TaxID=2942209 RepID=A0ABT0PZH9_9RHOB|nr:apolipoprotein acyltransferase [Ruegeria spongiae]MCL6283028.1 apolipoprotein acyltransferase [Ruegeria spongiae]
MIVIVLALIGAFLGGRTAAKRNGSKADVAQYAVGYGIAFAILGLILTIALDRFLI